MRYLPFAEHYRRELAHGLDLLVVFQATGDGLRALHQVRELEGGVQRVLAQRGVAVPVALVGGRGGAWLLRSVNRPHLRLAVSTPPYASAMTTSTEYGGRKRRHARPVT